MKIDIVTRTYYKHEKKLYCNLINTYHLFFSNLNCNLNIVLDDESLEDHKLGNKLITSKLVNKIYYEKLPDNWKELFQGISFGGAYGRWGYDRQQWSTFYFDKYSNNEIIGCVDSDSTFFSFLRPRDIFYDNKIKLHVVTPNYNHTNKTFYFLSKNDGDTYRNDKVALKIKTPYEYMRTIRMPIFFYKETFENCRNYISKKWNIPFDEAFKIFSRDEYSQFNILVNYALKFEKDKYYAVYNDREFIYSNNLISLGQNGCLRPFDIITGYIKSFNIKIDDLPERHRNLCKKYLNNKAHINRFANHIFPIKNNYIFYAHYNSIQKENKKLKYDLVLKKFIFFLDNDYSNIISQNNL